MTNECKCGKPTRDQAFVCDQCADDLSKTLGEIPWLEEQLEVTITGTSGIDYRTLGGTASATPPSPVHWGAAEARANLRHTLVTWTQMCHESGVRNSSPCTCEVAPPAIRKPREESESMRTTTTRCEFSDLLQSECGCARCRPDLATPPTKSSRNVGVAFTAKFDGKCAACGSATLEGETIGRTDDGDYICQGCFE